MSISAWQRWLKAPQTFAFRRMLVQIHLWLGITVGVYLFAICVSGSAVVLRPQISLWFIPHSVVSSVGHALTGEELEQAIASTYIGQTITYISEARFPGRATSVGVESSGISETRYFDQYSGEDLGSNNPWQVRVMEWTVDFHDNLLSGSTGRKINGIGGALFVLMIISGLVLWWPGRSRWRFSAAPLRGGRHSLLWQLHSVVGLWLAFLMLIWGITAIYFAIPAPFEDLVDWFDKDLNDFERPDAILLWLVKMHFGRIGGMWGRGLWIVLGLLPAFMYVSGFWLWWKKGIKSDS